MVLSSFPVVDTPLVSDHSLFFLCRLKTGVPQGSGLGLLLFNIRSLCTGVPQVSVPGPLLFNIIILCTGVPQGSVLGIHCFSFSRLSIGILEVSADSVLASHKFQACFSSGILPLVSYKAQCLAVFFFFLSTNSPLATHKAQCFVLISFPSGDSPLVSHKFQGSVFISFPSGVSLFGVPQGSVINPFCFFPHHPLHWHPTRLSSRSSSFSVPAFLVM